MTSHDEHARHGNLPSAVSQGLPPMTTCEGQKRASLPVLQMKQGRPWKGDDHLEFKLIRLPERGLGARGPEGGTVLSGLCLGLADSRQMSRPYRGISPNPEPSAQWPLIAIAVISQRPGEEMSPAPGTQLRNGKAEYLYSHCLYLTDNSVITKETGCPSSKKMAAERR